MRIWILVEGEKEGPFEEYQLRGRIQTGELNAETLAWYEGLDEWISLGEISVLTSEFEDKDRREVEELFKPPVSEGSGPIGRSPQVQVFEPNRDLWRRFLARWIDILVYQALLLSLFSLAGKDLYELINNPSFHVFHLVPLLLIEAWMLCQWGATPGKTIMKLKVVTAEGVPFQYLRALLRTSRVWFLGIGAVIPVLLLIGHILGAFCVRKFGAALWDFRSNQQVVETGQVSIRSWVAATLLIVVSLFMQLSLLMEPMVRYWSENEDLLTVEQRAKLEELNKRLKDH